MRTKYVLGAAATSLESDEFYDVGALGSSSTNDDRGNVHLRVAVIRKR